MNADKNIEQMREIVKLYDLLVNAQEATVQVIEHMQKMHMNKNVLHIDEKITTAFHCIYDALAELRKSKDVLRL